MTNDREIHAMTITAAAQATRKYSYHADKDRAWRVYDPDVPLSCVAVCSSHSDAQATCDRLNLLAVLESDAIREPSAGMEDAGFEAGLSANSETSDIWRAMINVLIAEVRNGNS